MTRGRRLLRRTRPRFWFYLAGPVLVGAVYGATTGSDLAHPVLIVLFLYFLLPANAYLYGINDIFDARIDRFNPKKSDREVPYTGDSATVWLVVVSGMLGILLLPVLPRESLPWMVGFLLLGAAYSAPPVRLKTTPFLDSIANGLYILPAGAAYALLAGGQPPLAAVVGGWLWAMSMHTFSAIPDIIPDQQGGIRTTATTLGHTGALVYCATCWSLAAIAMALVDIRFGILFAVYPVILAAIVASAISIDRAYWWYPGINTGVGMLMTIGGLLRVFHG